MALRTILLAVFTLLASVGPAVGQATPTPPGQPAGGPGGAAYRYAAVDAQRIGTEPTGAWLFVPLGAAKDEALPLVIFLHGFSALDPAAYRAWIDHLVRRGAVVVYPDYQRLSLDGLRPREYLANAVAGARAALDAASAGGWTINDGRVAVVGHSVGGVLALNIGAVAGRAGLPQPAAVFSVEPGGCAGCEGGPSGLGVPFVDLAATPAGTRVAILTGDADGVVGDSGAVAAAGLLAGADISLDRVTLRSDDHGRPILRAGHLAPLTAETGALDALDWFGLWKTFDLLTECGFAGPTCSGLLDPSLSADARDMGAWSDGTPVTPLLIEEEA